MARGKKKREEAALRPAMVGHIKALKLASVEEYLDWCRDRGFRAELEKSPYERREELAVPKQEAARAKERLRLHHNPRKFLQRACAGEIQPEDIDRPGWSDVCRAIAATNPEPARRQSLSDFLTQVERQTDFLFESESYGRRTLHYVDGLIRLHDRKKQWIRRLDNWRPGTHNIRRQFSALTRHLFASYPVPAFLDSAWMRRDSGAYRFRDWFIHIASGKNLRTAKTFFPMTKKLVHNFLAAPDHYSVEEALLWGEVHALGGDRRLTESLLSTRLGDRVERDQNRHSFWTSVYRFLVDNPLLDRSHVGPIVDFLNFQKFEEQEVMVGPGRLERRPPLQPNLSMNRRTPESLLRQVERWHGSLRTFETAAGHYFEKSGFSGLILETGSADSAGRKAQWHIRELLSGGELLEEGRQMNHCVASYTYSCSKGHCSIWTMERRKPDGKLEKHLTLELDKRGMLLQARGRQNRLPNAQELSVLDAWMRHAGLSGSVRHQDALLY